VAVNPLYKQQKKRVRGKPFAIGQSGNPAGRPPGARARATLLAEQLLDGEAAELAKKALAMALAGDVVAMRLCFERIIAPRRERGVRLALPAVKGAGDLGPAMAAVTAAAGEGVISPAEALDLSQVLESYIRAVAAADFERRLKELEAVQEGARRAADAEIGFAPGA
jgi:hypothetical protein